MNVLITGGLGYLGGRLAQYLSDLGHEVLLGTRRGTNSPDWLPHAKVVQIQWNSLDVLGKICDGVDAVVHTAGMNAQDCAADPVAALSFNGAATALLIQAAIRQGVSRFIYLSTAHVYGSPLVGTITEETCPANLHPYATSHRAGEDAVRFASLRGLIEGVVIRLSNSFGAPAHKNTNCWMLLVNDLCRQAVTTAKMVLHSSGLQRRDFVSMTGTCKAVGHLLHLPGQDLSQDVFNVGGQWAPTVWEMSCLVQNRCRASLGFEPKITRITPRIGETCAEFTYRLDGLLRTGFQPTADPAAEIDELLTFSKISFC